MAVQRDCDSVVTSGRLAKANEPDPAEDLALSDNSTGPGIGHRVARNVEYCG